jgi:hypothetical protein
MPPPAYRSAKPAGCMSCSARRLPLPQKLNPGRGESNYLLARIIGRNRNSPAIHPPKSNELTCLPIDGLGGDNGNGFVVSATKRSEPAGRR